MKSVEEGALDPENPVVRLCAQGMEAEAAGTLDDARELFQQGWSAARDDYERCIAAHYVARHQATPEAALRWNQECLRLAELVGDDRVLGFYASLHLNIGFSWETLGDRRQAAESYRLAETALSVLPPGPYADMVRDGVTRGLERLAAEE